jgi:hypothetical protein
MRKSKGSIPYVPNYSTTLNIALIVFSASWQLGKISTLINMVFG